MNKIFGGPWYLRLLKIFGFLVAAGIGLVILVLTFIAITLDRETGSTRRHVTSAYSKVSIPSKFQFKQRVSRGDGVDSSPGYTYYYVSPENGPKSLADMKVALEKQGFKLGPYSDIPEGILIEGNSSLGLQLDVEFRAPNNLSVVATEL